MAEMLVISGLVQLLDGEIEVAVLDALTEAGLLQIQVEDRWDTDLEFVELGLGDA